MKKFLLFLTILLSAVGIAQAEEVALPASGNTWANYTWTKSYSVDYTCSNLEGYTFFLKGVIGSTTAAPSSDMRIYAGGGKLTITAPDGTKFTKIQVTIADGNKATGATTSETSIWTVSGTASTTFSFEATTGQSSITFWGTDGNSTQKQMRIESITITTEGSAGEDLEDCGIAFTSTSESVDYPGTDYTLPFDNPNKVAVSFTSSKASVASVDENTGAVTINGCGTTTITASFVGNEKFAAKEVSCTLTVIDPSDLNATIDFSKQNYANQAEMKDQSVSIGSVSASFSKGSGANTPKYFTSGTAVRMYAGNTLTFTAPENHYITKIEFTGSTGSDYGFNNLKLTDGQAGTYTYASDEKSGEWVCGTSEPTSVQFAAYANDTNGKVYIKTITVHYAALSNKKAAGLTYAETEVTKLVGADPFINPLTKPDGLTVTYATDPAESTVATVNASTGEVTVLAAGTVTIVASSAETETYKAGSASYKLTVADKYEAGLAYAPESVSLVEGETLTQPTLSNTNELTVSYTSDNEAVATVNTTTGEIALAGGIGTAVITASTEGDATHKAGTATFTIKVKKAQVAYLVTDASILQPGDIIIIANQEYGKAISNAENGNNRKVTDVTFNADFSEITSIPDDVMLVELTQTDTYWSFKTTNYLGTNGYFTTSESATDKYNYLQITQTQSDYTLATINITDGVATIKLNKGSDPSTSNNAQNRNIIRFNPNTANNNPLFSCYASGQDDVYIYKVTDKPATVGGQAPGFSFAAKGEKENLNVIVLDNLFETSTTAEKVAIYLDNVLVGTYAVEEGMVEAKFDYIPYLPTAKFTMRPVLKEEGGVPTQVGPAEVLEFIWPALDDQNAFTYGLDDEKIFCVNEDSAEGPWILYGQFFFIDVFEKGNLDYDVSVKAVNNADPSQEYTDAEFAWGDGGFYVSIPNFFTTNAWDEASGRPNITGCTVPVVKFIATPSYEFTYDTKYSSLVTTPAGAPARLKVPGATATQTITCTPQEIAISTLTNETAVSGVEGVTVDGGAAVEYFNLQGVRVDGDLAPGIYIRRQGQTVSKIQIR